MMGYIISIANPKRGVGKTTVTVNLADGLARNKKSVLVIDFDPQMNTTETLINGITGRDVFTFLTDDYEIIDDYIIKTHVRNIDLLPSSLSLAKFESYVLFNHSLSPSTRFRDRLPKDFKDRYDYILIDLAPSLGLLTSNAFVASDYIISPVEISSTFSISAVGDVIKLINIIKSHNLNPDLELLGVLINKMDKRKNLCKKNYASAKDSALSKFLLNTIISINSPIERAIANRKTIFEYDYNAFGARQFLALAKEVINKTENLNEQKETK